MAKTKKDIDDIKWQCPICGDIRYQQYGGVPVTGTNEFGTPAIIHYGKHYMCKGCSIFFSNPKLFNALIINKDRLCQSKIDEIF